MGIQPGENPRKVSIMSQSAEYTADPVTDMQDNVCVNVNPAGLP